MAKVNGVATQLSGKVGQLIYRQTKYGTVVYEAPSKASIPQRTEAQMQVRTQWGNMAAIYRQFNQTLKKGFEGLNGKMNDYNAFIQANTNVVKVYVPKSVRLNGGSVLAPYQINLRFSSFAPRQCSSKLGTALGLASVSARYAAERGDSEEQRGCAGERHRPGWSGDRRGDHGGGPGERGDCLQRGLRGGRSGDVLLRSADDRRGDGDSPREDLRV